MHGVRGRRGGLTSADRNFATPVIFRFPILNHADTMSTIHSYHKAPRDPLHRTRAPTSGSHLVCFPTFKSPGTNIHNPNGYASILAEC